MAGMRLIGCALIAAALTAQETSPFKSVQPLPEGLRFDAPLPAFEAKDIAGRTWRIDDLRGKYTLIYLWNTFEARAVDARPHVREIISGLSDLPEVQRFYEKVRGKQTIQVLTFCRDYDYTHAPEYMKEKSYSFPVIADWTLAKKLFARAAGSAPYLVVDRDARLSSPIRSWSLGRVMYEIESAARR